MMDDILTLLEKEITKVMQQDVEFYGNYKVYLSKEQQYVKEKQREKGAIYLVVKFMPSSINFGQNVISVSINAVGEANKIEVCQKLLLELALTYNLTKDESGKIMQTFTTPSIMSNFNDVFDDFRSLFYMSATFLISKDANEYKTYFKSSINGEYQLIETITTAFDLSVNLDPQTFYGSQDFTKSASKTATLTLSFTTYLMINDFMTSILKIVDKTKSINENFLIKVEFNDGTVIEGNFKLANFSIQQNIGQLAIASITITN